MSSRVFGLVCLSLGVVFYIANVALIRHYLNKRTPGLLELDASLPAPPPGGEYLWEKTAGTGVVPRWVSQIGLLALPLLAIGVISLLVSLFR